MSYKETLYVVMYHSEEIVGIYSSYEKAMEEEVKANLKVWPQLIPLTKNCSSWDECSTILYDYVTDDTRDDVKDVAPDGWLPYGVHYKDLDCTPPVPFSLSEINQS